MKRICLSLICSGFFVFSQAQISFGPKLGLNVVKISFSSPDFKSSFRPDFYGGGFANYKVNEHWSGQFEILYSGEGGKERAAMGTDNGHINASYVQIPLLAQYHSAMGFYGEAGPQIGLLMSIKETFNGETQSIKQYYKKADFRFPFGIGYEFPSTSPVKGLGINARYSFSLSKINKDAVGGDRLKNNVISIGAFYRIPMGK